MNIETRIEKLERKIGGGKKPSREEIMKAAGLHFTRGEPFPYDAEDFPFESMNEHTKKWIEFLLSGGRVGDA